MEPERPRRKHWGQRVCKRCGKALPLLGRESTRSYGVYCATCWELMMGEGAKSWQDPTAGTLLPENVRKDRSFWAQRLDPYRKPSKYILGPPREMGPPRESPWNMLQRMNTQIRAVPLDARWFHREMASVLQHYPGIVMNHDDTDTYPFIFPQGMDMAASGWSDKIPLADFSLLVSIYRGWFDRALAEEGWPSWPPGALASKIDDGIQLMESFLKAWKDIDDAFALIPQDKVP